MMSFVGELSWVCVTRMRHALFAVGFRMVCTSMPRRGLEACDRRVCSAGMRSGCLRMFVTCFSEEREVLAISALTIAFSSCQAALMEQQMVGSGGFTLSFLSQLCKDGRKTCDQHASNIFLAGYLTSRGNLSGASQRTMHEAAGLVLREPIARAICVIPSERFQLGPFMRWVDSIHRTPSDGSPRKHSTFIWFVLLRLFKSLVRCRMRYHLVQQGVLVAGWKVSGPFT